MRSKGRIDANQKAIVAVLRKCGADVQSLANIGSGVPDLLIYHSHCGYVLAEVEDGSKPPSAQRLTPDEEAFHARWHGRIEILRSVDGALKLIGAK